jgi:hypothetical protein
MGPSWMYLETLQRETNVGRTGQVFHPRGAASPLWVQFPSAVCASSQSGHAGGADANLQKRFCTDVKDRLL